MYRVTNTAITITATVMGMERATTRAMGTMKDTAIATSEMKPPG